MATVKQEISLLARQAAAIRLLREQMVEELAEIDQQPRSITPAPWSPPSGWWDDYPADEEESSPEGQWEHLAGGSCLEVKTAEGWRILAFVTPNVRRTGWILEVSAGAQIGVAFERHGRSSHATLKEAMAAAETVTGVEAKEGGK